MDLWGMLEIEPTNEISVIKRAYAKQLKIYHPEEDPRGFQKLREAYVEALEYAKDYEHYQNDYIHHNSVEEEKDCLQEEDNDSYVAYHRSLDLADVAGNGGWLSEKIRFIDDFLNKIDILYNNFFDRIMLENWKELFNNDIIWDLTLRDALRWDIWNYLSGHYYIPRDVWKFLNDTFQWIDNDDFIYDYSEEFINYVNLQLGSYRVPSYHYLNQNVDIDYNEYLTYREEAFLALHDKNIWKANKFIYYAESIYKDDPALFCIKGEYHYWNKEYKLGDIEFEAAASLSPDDYQILFYKAQVMYDCGLYQEAFQIFKIIIEKSKNNQDVYLFIERSAFKSKKLWEASQLLMELLKKDPSNWQAEKILNKIIKYYEKQNNFPDYKIVSKIYGGLGDKDKEIEFKKKSIKTLLYAILLLAPWLLLTLLSIAFLIVIVYKCAISLIP